jgi:lipopolysaccharide transport system ATP-binding protein
MSCNNFSSDENVLEFDHVSKRYESTASWVHSSLRHFLRRRKKKASSIGTQDESFPWAVRDLNFTIKRGEAVGIIGENGAGKSTILKLMAGIITPTTGHILSRGRLVSLIELGAGFNPELSGRENIYLNGAVLGLSRNEIAEEF